MSEVIFTIRDRSDEYSSVTVPLTDITAANFADVMAEISNLQTAILGMTTGTLAQRRVVLSTEKINDTRPSNPYAQRELGLRLFYQDTVNFRKYHLTVPCPDLLLVGQAGSDEIDLTLSVVAVLVNWLESNMTSPDGNSVDVYRGVIVGRRN